MAILIDETKRVLVQGITGREGQARTRLMREYGTNVVAGVTPGKGGQSVLGVPVFNTPQDAVESVRRDRHLRAFCARGRREGRGHFRDRRGDQTHGAGARSRAGVGRDGDRGGGESEWRDVSSDPTRSAC